MKREAAEQYLSCAMSIGEEMLVCGAEVRRVEDTIRRICTAYGAARVDVFSITSSIVTTMFGPEFGSCTQTRRISGTAYDLHKMDALNQLSRRICRELPAPDVIERDLQAILNGPRYSFPMQVAVYGMVSGSFSLFFGGNAGDVLASVLIGVLIKFLESCLKRGPGNTLLTALLCSTAGGFLANIAVRAGLGNHVDLISIGNVMLLIPGIAFTNSLRDLFAGDTITGLIRFMESLLLASIIALGFTFANFLL